MKSRSSFCMALNQDLQSLSKFSLITLNFKDVFTLSVADLEGGARGVRPPPPPLHADSQSIASSQSAVNSSTAPSATSSISILDLGSVNKRSLTKSFNGRGCMEAMGSRTGTDAPSPFQNPGSATDFIRWCY